MSITNLIGFSPSVLDERLVIEDDALTALNIVDFTPQTIAEGQAEADAEQAAASDDIAAAEAGIAAAELEVADLVLALEAAGQVVTDRLADLTTAQAC